MLDDMAFKQKMVRQVYSSCFRRLAPLHVSSEKGKKISISQMQSMVWLLDCPNLFLHAVVAFNTD
jgi:hypothetical protein